MPRALGDRFRIGRVVARSFSIWGRELPILLALALLVHVPRIAVVESLSRVIPRQPRINVHEPLGRYVADLETWCQEAAPLDLVLWLSNEVLADMMIALVVVAAYARLRGRRPGFGESVRALFRRLPLVLAVSLFFGAVWGGARIGLAFLGPTMVGTWWGAGDTRLYVFLVGWYPVFLSLLMGPFLVATPAAVLEGSWKALGRSVRLTRGHWLAAGAALLLFYVTHRGLGLVVFLAGLSEPRLLRQSVGWTERLAFGSFFGVFAAVAYHALRMEKEGPDVSDVGPVFE